MRLGQATGRVGERWTHLSGVMKLFLLLLLAAALGYWWWQSGNSATRNRRPQAPISVTAAVHKDVPVWLDGLGTVQAHNTVTVHTQVDGQLLSFGFEEGQQVHKGDVLAQIDPRTYQAQVDQAKANKARDEATLENARRDLDRYAKLGTAISNQTLDTQRATVRQAEATVKADQAMLDNSMTLLSYTTIVSPIDGRTGIRQVDPGNIVHSSDANGLVVITQLQPIDAIFSLPQQNVADINKQVAKQGKLQVVATAADMRTPIDTGALELVDNQIDANTGTVKLKAVFPNTDNSLWPGGFVNIRMLLMTRTDALVVPTVAVQRGPNNVSYVFIYHPDTGTVSMRPIKVAMIEDQDTVLDDGVKEGEQVVTDGMAKLQDGSKVVLAGAGDTDKAAGDTPEKKDDSARGKKQRHKHDKEG